jgi:hypothetical protein
LAAVEAVTMIVRLGALLPSRVNLQEHAAAAAGGVW